MKADASQGLRVGPPGVLPECEPEPRLRLTPRQLEVLALLGEGLPNKLICRQLDISTGTVKVHISGILRELGAKSRLQAVVLARRHGLLAENVPALPAIAPASREPPRGVGHPPPER